MVSKTLVFLLMISVLASAGISQATYSESTAYRPREFSDSKKERKKETKTKAENGLGAVENEVTVTIPVAVLNQSGLAIGGLTRHEVSVFVDDVELPISAFEQYIEPLNLILMLDSSPSPALPIEKIREQAVKLVKALPTDTKVMVIDFNVQINVLSQLTTNRAETLASISKIETGDSTSIYAAIRTLYEKILPPIAGRKVVVLISDGVDWSSEKSTFANSLREVEKEDVTIYSIYDGTRTVYVDPPDKPHDPITLLLRNRDVGTRDWPSTRGASETDHKKGFDYLKDLASASGGRVLSSEKMETGGIKSLLSEFANRYYIIVKVPRKNAGSRTIRVRVNRPSLRVLARGSFVEK